MLAVKIEVDTRSTGWPGLDTGVIRRHVTLRLQTRSVLAIGGKAHALFCVAILRPDLYELMGNLSDPDWPDPNLMLLHNAYSRPVGMTRPNEEIWWMMLSQRLGKIDWKNAVADVKPFLERIDEVELLTPGNFEKLLNCSDIEDRLLTIRDVHL